MLQNAGLDGIRSYATTPIPFGFWQKKANCNFDGIPTTSSFTGVDKPKWMESAAPDAPVYMQRPGEAVFNMICINCHGTNFDSLGRQAENLMLMTGGNARVANFRFGLFGPSTMPGANRPRVFGATDAGVGVTPDDMGARYMAWMALGGTSQTIPPAILGVVANTDVLGARREWSSGVSSANMLDTAKTLCGNVLGVRRDFEFNINVNPSPTGDLGFITTNGDADLWPILCSQGNPPPLRAVNVKIIDGVVKAWEVRAVHDLYPTDNYKDAPVVDHLGRLKTGIDKDNFVPWCIRQPISADRRKLTDESIQMRPLPGGGLAPYCPTSVVPATDGAPPAEDGHWSVVDDDTNTLWATRGAISVGQAIFLFLDDAISGRTQPLPRYDRCDLIKH
jgi:mono/diheme cytochrome c family protein